MASEIPIVRHFIVCRGITLSADNREATLQSLVSVVVSQPGEAFPLRVGLALYALLTNGRGEHEFSLRFAFVERGEEGTEAEERVIRTSPPVRIDLGSDPTVVHGLPMPNVLVDFWTPGQYTFYLLCDGQPIAHEHLEARQSHETE